ncbi:DUF1775 domain-containing protein [Lapillicoccus sp.]|uniref:DUF1775 domain-containing protein n=1 Tax=Lapillicoccus sp. TaxID=1909287 RepID=UPI0032661439
MDRDRHRRQTGNPGGGGGDNAHHRTAPHQVTWTATGDAAIAPGEYQTFAISGGRLPAPGVLVFPADQTYSDGTVVSWWLAGVALVVAAAALGLLLVRRGSGAPEGPGNDQGPGKA